MSSQYASFHLFNSNRKEILKQIKENYSATSRYIWPIYVCQNDNKLSVYSDSFDYLSIEESAKDLLAGIDTVCVYIGSNSFDYLRFGIVRNGQITPCGTIGEYLEEFELEAQAPDIEAVAQAWGAESPLANEEAQNLDVCDFEQTLENLLQIKGHRYVEDFADYSDQFKTQELASGLFLCEANDGFIEKPKRLNELSDEQKKQMQEYADRITESYNTTDFDIDEFTRILKDGLKFYESLHK